MAIKEYSAKIVSIVEQSPSVRLFELELEEDFQFKAGQFLNLAFEHEGIKYMKPYSIASVPEGSNRVELSIKLVPEGRATPHLWKKQVGDEFFVRGPFGLFTIRNEKEKLVFIGTGTGVAPLRSMIIDLIRNKAIAKEILLIFGVRYENEILFEEEFEKLQNENPNFKFVKIVSRPSENWPLRKGHVQENFDMVDIMNSEFYICGLPDMYEGAKKKLLEMGADEKVIYHEVFR